MLFVEHLTRILTDYMPDLWRLGQAYFSGKLFKEVRPIRFFHVLVLLNVLIDIVFHLSVFQSVCPKMFFNMCLMQESEG